MDYPEKSLIRTNALAYCAVASATKKKKVLKRRLQNEIKTKGGNEMFENSSSTGRLSEEKLMEREKTFERKFEKFEKDLQEKQRVSFNNLKQELETMRVEISSSILRDVSRDFVAKV